MFISNIISKLSAIIYKPKIIYKATTAPTNKDQQPHSNYYKYKFHWTTLHDLLTHSTHDNKPIPLSFSFSYTSTISAYTCFSFLTHILTWVVEFFVLQVSPSVKGTSPSRRVKFGDAILPTRGPITKVMARRLQEDWVRDVGEGPRVLMSFRIDFGPWAKYKPTYLCTY